ncbi:MAG: energy transducer TonB [Rudaea sp.]|nr:energy transducer TonB [Rudaea sp.]
MTGRAESSSTAANNPIMAARNSSPVLKFIPIVVILIGIAIAVYFFLPRGSNAPAPSTAPTPGAAPGAAQPNAAAAPATPMPELSKEQLIKEAGTAFREQRYVAPQGNNALEYYLRVLEKEPNNQTATDALREMFPFATGAVEQNINAGNVDEATREIDLLAKADPSNYTLTILRGKLDARKKQVEHEQQQTAAAAAATAAKAAAAAAGATPNPAAPAVTTPAAAPASNAAAPAASTTANPAPAAAAPTAAPPAAAAAPPPPTVGESHAAEVLKTVPPEYPRDAYIKHTEGWVEVEFTVTPDGQVANATVAGANPARVFNDAALRAVQRWTFKPKMDNGKAVEERMKRRIEFKLGAG